MAVNDSTNTSEESMWVKTIDHTSRHVNCCTQNVPALRAFDTGLGLKRDIKTSRDDEVRADAVFTCDKSEIHLY